MNKRIETRKKSPKEEFTTGDFPWETTPHMIRSQEMERNRSTFDYEYNSKTGKVERL